MLEQFIRTITGQDRPTPKVPPVDVFTVPDEHVRHLYQLLDRSETWPELEHPLAPCPVFTIEDFPGYHSFLMWQWIHEIMPVLPRDHSLHLNSENIVKPTIEVLATKLKDTASGHTTFFKVPREHRNHTANLQIRQYLCYPSERLARYEMWRFLGELFPETILGNWSIGFTEEDFVIGKNKATMEEEQKELETFRKQLDEL